MIITRAAQTDLPAIVGLEREGFDHASWSEDAWRDEITSTDRHVLVCRDHDEGVIGVATFQTVADVADLHRVVVRADQRSRGVGRTLVYAGFEWAEAMGADEMMLEVEYDNVAARTLYARLGFTPVSRRDDYYGAGRHALVLSRPLRAHMLEGAPA